MSKKSIGIDFGTCNTTITSYDGTFNSIGDSYNLIIPTCLYYDELTESFIFGTDATYHKDKVNYIHGFKRLICTNIDILKKQYAYGINEDGTDINIIMENGKIITLKNLLVVYFNNIKQLINDKMHDIGSTVITVPAYFNEHQRTLIMVAAEEAGFNKCTLLNEPTSAAYYYINTSFMNVEKDAVNNLGSNYNDMEGYMLIFDIGGGTTDLTLLYVDNKNEVIQVIATLGNCELGGTYFNKELLVYCIKILGTQGLNIKNIVQNKKIVEYITNACDTAKQLLSIQNNTTIYLEILGCDYQINITRDILNNLCNKYFVECMALFEKILQDSQIKKSDIRDVLLVGGPTKMPKLVSLIQDMFKDCNTNICLDMDPKFVVSMGAALYGYNVNTYGNNDSDNDSRSKELLLVDVTPLNLGIITHEGLCILIEKNTSIPCSKQKVFSTYYDNQRAIDIKIIQGTSENDYKIIGNMKIINILPMIKKEPRINVEFYINKSGILSVYVVEEFSNIKGCVVINL